MASGSVELEPFHFVDPEDLLERARRPLSARPRAFLRWAGAKRWLLPTIVGLLPPTFGRYWEPFLGGGSLFFLLRPELAVLSDACAELMETYRAVRTDASSVLAGLDGLGVDRDTYYRVRDRPKQDRLTAAGDFLYLNKTCWNGLYRVNQDGKFNVPYGWPKSGNIVDPNNLLECSQVLARPGVQLLTGDFADALTGVRPGDLVFLDPPYVTSHNDNGFVDYNEILFSWKDQVRLASLAADLRDLGATVIATNADHRDLRGLYEGFKVMSVGRHSTLAGDSTMRRPVKEVVIYSIHE